MTPAPIFRDPRRLMDYESTSTSPGAVSPIAFAPRFFAINELPHEIVALTVDFRHVFFQQIRSQKGIVGLVGRPPQYSQVGEGVCHQDSGYGRSVGIRPKQMLHIVPLPPGRGATARRRGLSGCTRSRRSTRLSCSPFPPLSPGRSVLARGAQSPRSPALPSRSRP